MNNAEQRLFNCIVYTGAHQLLNELRLNEWWEHASFLCVLFCFLQLLFSVCARGCDSAFLISLLLLFRIYIYCCYTFRLLLLFETLTKFST